MKVSYPLSVKVSLWLLCNLMLLAAVGTSFFIVQGGVTWSALVAGVAGDRAQAIANVIAGEVSAAALENRDAVLARFGAAYRADFILFRSDGTHAAGVPVELPPAVRERLEFRPPGRWPRGDSGGSPDEYRRFLSGDRSGSPRRSSAPAESGPAESSTTGGSESGEVRPETPGAPRRDLAESARAVASDPSRERERNRFVVRAGSPANYWVGLRVPFTSLRSRAPGGFGSFGGPSMLIVRLGSFWAVLRFLDLEPWLFAGTGVLALSVLFWLPLVRGITSSLSQLTLATERIAEGRFDTRVPAGRRDEIGRLGDSVNRMASRIDTHMTGQKRFLGDVAHELCSPLARMQMATGILADQAPPGLAPTVADVREEVQHMSSLVNELLAFTKAGLRPRDVKLSAVELAPLVERVIAREDASTGVTVQIHPAVRVIAEPELLERALANLVRNAVRYAGTTGPVVLSAQSEKNRVIVAIEDEGPGVPPAALERLGDPFFRPESARTRETGGVGLGLAIVRSSVLACGGEVHFANRSPRGFRAEIRLGAA
jgi:two-component system, OmpR family, sensor histidine kinase CpxA